MNSLEKRPSVQLVSVGPVIDLYGRFAAEKLNRLMELYPDRVFSKPEFTALPPFLFSGADFALIPSRDEPFGLVAVEFGRKGALGVGSRLGGLGLMPGWVCSRFHTRTQNCGIDVIFPSGILWSRVPRRIYCLNSRRR
jgi:alpha-1,3-glucan synthase